MRSEEERKGFWRPIFKEIANEVESNWTISNVEEFLNENENLILDLEQLLQKKEGE